MKKVLLFGLSFLMVTTMAWSQGRTVSGKVTSIDDGSTLPGVNVVVKGTTNGGVTDMDGNYKITVPNEGGTLVFSFIGLASQEVEIGSRDVIDVEMSSDVKQLGEVVVTAIGMSQEKKALGYGVTTLDSDQLGGKQESDIARILRGKATGVQITQTSGLSGSGTNVIIRGYSSISGTNQPLFVVDGIPFNTSTNSGNQSFASGSASASSRFLDLDPNNIENVTILKGLSATVLYGENGRNGVVLVTTKNGKGGGSADNKMEISVSQGVYSSQIANLPDYQNTFGNGFNAGFGWFFSNWGAAFADRNPSSYGSDYKGETADGQVLITHPYDQPQYNDDFPEYIGADYVYEPRESVENFFKSGLSYNTSVSMAGGLGESASFSATYSFLSEDGFTPRLDELRGGGRSNYLDKHNFGLGVQGELKNGLKIQESFNYVSSERLTPITAPAFGGDGNGLFAAILFTPRSMDLMGLPYQSPIDGSNVYYRRGSAIQNPRWTLNNTGQTEKLRRFFSSTQLSYDIGEHIQLLYRLSIDNYSQVNNRFINKGGPRTPDGELRTFTIGSNTVDQLVNFIYNYNLSSAWTVSGVVGFNSRLEEGTQVGTLSTEQFVYNFNEHQNFISHDSYSVASRENTLGILGTATFGLNNYLFINLQGRNDWTSTLEQANRSKFYPSVSASFVPTDAFESISYSKALSFLKVRAGFGTSAGYPNPYRTRNTLNSNTNVFVSQGGTILNTNSVSSVLGNPDLKPEIHQEIEVGLEVKLLNNIFGIDLSLYQKNSEDLIIDLPLDPSTGYLVTTVNAAAMENKGIELGFNVRPPIGEKYSWDMTFNFTKNISKVTEIYPGIDQVQTAGYTTLGNYAIPGEPYGVLYGETFLRNDAGELIVDNQGSYQSSGDFGIIGDPNPNYNLVWINSFTWKGLSFGFQFAYTDGGDMYSSTVQALLARGNTTDTDVDRNVPIIMPNAVKDTGGENADGSPIYAPNDIQTYIGDSYFDAYFGADEGGVFDATVIRLQEISLSYVLPGKLLEKTPFGNITFSIAGENLFYYAPNFPKGINFDPEVSSLGVGNGRGFDFRTAPTAKKVGGTVTFTF